MNAAFLTRPDRDGEAHEFNRFLIHWARLCGGASAGVESLDDLRIEFPEGQEAIRDSPFWRVARHEIKPKRSISALWSP